VAFGQPVPTLSEWGVIVLLLSLGIAGALHARRYDN